MEQICVSNYLLQTPWLSVTNLSAGKGAKTGINKLCKSLKTLSLSSGGRKNTVEFKSSRNI